MAVSVDTNVLFAMASARDEYHETASEILTSIDHGDLPQAVITNYVLAETLNLVREKLGPDSATALLDRLIEATHFEVSHAAQSDFTTAQALFRQYPALSFVDATIVAYMDRESIEYLYSFDADFDAIDGITRLTTAVDPSE